MNGLEDIIKIPLLESTHKQYRNKVKVKFPELNGCLHNNYLSVYKYLSKSPYRFYSQSSYKLFSAWLKDRNDKNQPALKRYLADHNAEINRAFLHLEEINALDWHDYFDKIDDYELIRHIDHKIHPTYLRLTEAVYTPLCRIIAYFLRKDRNKGTEGLDLYSIKEEISKSDLSSILASYKHIIRNGIAHGGITYYQQEIQYQDKKGNKSKFADRDIIRIFDDLLDTCNAMLLAISLFLLVNQPSGYNLPQELLLMELREATRTPWWEIIGCTPSKFTGLNQLIVYARPNTSDFNKVQYSTFQSGVLVELFAPGYDRYFFSIWSLNALPGWAAFNGKKLNKIRQKQNIEIEDYKGTVEDDLVFYVPKIRMPRIVSKIQNLILSFMIHMPIAISDIKRQLEWPDIRIRETSIHRNAWGVVLKGNIVVEFSDGEISQDRIRKFKKRYIHKALVKARKQTSLLNISRYLPIGYARIGIFSKDHRRRRLISYGLGKDLICTIQIKRIKRIKAPDIMGATIEQINKYRIAWNQAWLNEGLG